MTIPRRTFLHGAAVSAAAAASAAAAGASPIPAHGAKDEAARADERKRPRFGLHYAPHFGMFRAHAGGGLEDQLRFMADEGFDAMEDNGMAGRGVSDQDSVAKVMAELGMTMGVFVAHAEFRGPTFVEDPADARERIEKDMATCTTSRSRRAISSSTWIVHGARSTIATSSDTSRRRALVA